jgi:hypothetical protein
MMFARPVTSSHLTGRTALELDLRPRRLVGRVLGEVVPDVVILRDAHLQVVHLAGADRAAPHGQVVADTRLVGDVVVLAELLLLLAREVELAHRHDDLEVRGEDREDVRHAVLIVALARRALADGVTALLDRVLGDLARDELSSHRRRDRVALVVRVGADRAGDPLAGELVGRLHHLPRHAKLLGLRAAALDLLVGQADVDGDRENLLGAVVLGEQLDGERGVEAARERQRDLLDLRDLDLRLEVRMLVRHCKNLLLCVSNEGWQPDGAGGLSLPVSSSGSSQ